MFLNSCIYLLAPNISLSVTHTRTQTNRSWHLILLRGMCTSLQLKATNNHLTWIIYFAFVAKIILFIILKNTQDIHTSGDNSLSKNNDLQNASKKMRTASQHTAKEP